MTHAKNPRPWVAGAEGFGWRPLRGTMSHLISENKRKEERNKAVRSACSRTDIRDPTMRFVAWRGFVLCLKMNNFQKLRYFRTVSMGKRYDYICKTQNKYKIEHWSLKELLKTKPDKKRIGDSSWAPWAVSVRGSSWPSKLQLINYTHTPAPVMEELCDIP